MGDSETPVKYVRYKKALLIGTSGTGKSTLCSYLQGTEYKSLTPPEEEENDNNEGVVNGDYMLNVFPIELDVTKGECVSLNVNVINADLYEQILETATTLFYEVDLVIFIIDITSIESFKKMEAIAAQTLNKLPKEVSTILLTNKEDQDAYREISGFEIKLFKDKFSFIKEHEVTLTQENCLDKVKEEIINSLKEQLSASRPNNLIKYQNPPKLGNSKLGLIAGEMPTTIKLFLLGNSAVGKTSFIKRYFQHEFGNTITTLGVDVEKTLVFINNKPFKIEVWDTAGQERLRSIPRQYYSKGDGFILMFDVTSKGSFTDVTSWIRDIRENNNAGTEIKILLIGNKVDNLGKREVSRDEAESLAKEHRLNYGEISCKSGLNIRESMMNLIIEAYTKMSGNQNAFDLQGGANVKGKKKCC
jgi:small GTP-binding protein